jgi:hypothetical protein
MNTSRRMLIAVVSAAVALTSLVPASPVAAAVTVSVSKTSALVEGEQVTISLAGIPTGQGVYIRQCYKPTTGQRDASGLKCNGSLQRISEMIWASTNPVFLRQGAASASSAISLAVKANVLMYEADGKTVKETLPCGVSDCAIFVHRDHLGLQDTALDTIVPLTFLRSQAIKARVMGLPRDGASRKLGSSISLKASTLVTDQKAVVRVSSDTPGVCSVVKGATSTSIRFESKGSCIVQLVAKATSTHQRFAATFTYVVRRNG